MRTLHSVINRSPRELLDEIILVNDASTKEKLHETMANYIDENFGGKVKLVKLEQRVGLIVARMEGAKRATAEVLVFLDSHIEVNVNWLPPLLGCLFN
jgi:polypeptide N-acetylgalactosaminyltransferase